ncbi:DUF2163 domain-containing protein [Xanthobacter sp. KR7-225]|uniref:DUF2163 domain-containing protein n=1 Tax=Xanthobacter sp. KR7-225 TaxID=3156613 RepID=UPI0032B52061
MRELPAALAARLAAGVTTFCTAVRVTRRDGVVLGFTDHDRDLVVDGTPMRAASGIAPSENTLALGLAVTGAELSGALSSDALAADDLAAGLYDGAQVDLLLVDWSAPESFVLLRSGTIGEVRSADGVFTAEVRSRADALGAARGRLYAARCDADLGDARCGVDLDAPAHGATASVIGADGPRLVLAGLGEFAPVTFARGRLVFTSGACAGFASAVKSHLVEDGAAVVRLWQRPPFAVAPGDAARLTAGCDKAFSTCRDRFANALNFRGFPHMPGNDFVITVAVPGEGGYDGGLLS